MPGPVAPKARPGRLGGLRGPPPQRKRVPTKPAATAAPTCPNKDCSGPDIVEEDGMLVCKGCFTQIARSDIVAEVTFEENAGGRATVQGGTVNDNSRHARTLGAGAYRKVGGGERNSLADIQQAGRKAMENLCPKLGIIDSVQMQAVQIWALAANINFSAGRRTDEVVAACLYAACRRQKDNKVLLMDIAELIQINVFRLGEVYKDMCKDLYMNNESVGHQHLVELEPLIYKYCDKLQFAEKTKDVAEDALKIIRRMNRDYIVSGRHPAGLCGACIILAARMNNFQRTVREVVFVSKVADITIAKRVEEFRRTKSSGLSIDDFRKYANRIKDQHDPPSSFAEEARARKFARQRARRQEHMQMKEARESQLRESQRLSQPITIPDDATDASSRLSSLEPGTPAPEMQIQQQAPEASMSAPSVQQPMPAPPTDGMPATQSPTQDSNKRKRDEVTAIQNGQETQESSGSPKRQRVDGPHPDAAAFTPPITQETNKRKRDDVEDVASTQDEEASPANGGSPKRRRNEGSPSADSARASQPPATQAGPGPQLRYDDEGFLIPAIPIAAPAVPTPPTGTTQPPAKRGRGRPKKADQPPEIVISEEELAEEDYLEKQIEEALENGEVQESQTEVEKLKEEARVEMEKERAIQLAQQQQKLDCAKNKAAREARGVNYFGEATEGEILTAEDLEAEFANDPEVANCLLSETEVKIKERIWVTHNEDWLRKQAEKALMQLINKDTGGDKRGKNGKVHKARGKKRSKMGDGSVLTESNTPIETPADAARAMLEKRAPLKSAHVDFSALQRIYGRSTPSRDRDSSATPNDSASQTPATGSRAASEALSESAAAAGASEPASPEGDGEVDEGEQQEEEPEEGPSSVSKHLKPAGFEDIPGDDERREGEDDEDDDEEEAFDRARRIGTYGNDEDEFGVIGGFDDGYDDDGYEEV